MEDAQDHQTLAVDSILTNIGGVEDSQDYLPKFGAPRYGVTEQWILLKEAYFLDNLSRDEFG